MNDTIEMMEEMNAEYAEEIDSLEKVIDYFQTKLDLLKGKKKAMDLRIEIQELSLALA